MKTHQRFNTLSVKPSSFKKIRPISAQKASSSCGDLKKSLIVRLKIPREIIHKVFPPQKPSTVIVNRTAEKSASVLGSTGNKNRDYIQENVAKTLRKAAEEVGSGSEKVGELAVFIESELFEAWGVCTGPTKQKYLSMLYNLRDEKNPDFRKRVLQGYFWPEELPSLAPKDMASEARRMEDQKILDAKKEQEIKVAQDDYVMQKD